MCRRMRGSVEEGEEESSRGEEEAGGRRWEVGGGSTTRCRLSAKMTKNKVRLEMSF